MFNFSHLYLKTDALGMQGDVYYHIVAVPAPKQTSHASGRGGVINNSIWSIRKQ